MLAVREDAAADRKQVMPNGLGGVRTHGGHCDTGTLQLPTHHSQELPGMSLFAAIMDFSSLHVIVLFR
jgi:hypothetical protein